MPIEEVVKKYISLIKTESFAKYEKDFAYKVQLGLCKGYKQRSTEPEMVSKIKGIVNELNGLSASANRFRISTKSIFIHGNRSQVEFDYYEEKSQRELGDLIFILSVIYNQRKYFEKYTISQFKKDDGRLRWDLSNKEQVYLLSRFPPFRGIRSSIIPMSDFNLPNYSGFLGSFNLLFSPGDFVHVSAAQLDNILGPKKTVSMADISKLWGIPGCFFTCTPYHYWPCIEELLYIWYKFCRDKLYIPFYLPYNIGILGFSSNASNIYDFVDKYLRGYIGELSYSDVGVYNKPALDFLCELLSAIMRKTKKEEQKGKKNEHIMNFIKEFFGRPYGGNGGNIKKGDEFDFNNDESVGIGIVYTSIDLGEGE